MCHIKATSEDAQNRMRSIHRTLRSAPLIIPKNLRSRAVLFGMRFKTVLRTRNHIKLKSDAGVTCHSNEKHIISIKDSEGNLLA